MVVSAKTLQSMTRKDRWGYLTKGCNAEKRKRFVQYHRDNPHVFDKLLELATEAYNAGVPRISHWLLLNEIRWQFGVVAYDPNSPFKISNDYFAFYARLLFVNDPKFVDLISIKELKG